MALSTRVRLSPSPKPQLTRRGRDRMSSAVSCSHAVAVTARASNATRRTAGVPTHSAARLPTRKALCGAQVASGRACARVARGSVTTQAVTPLKFSFGASRSLPFPACKLTPI
jgi:hypothetical protein